MQLRRVPFISPAHGINFTHSDAGETIQAKEHVSTGYISKLSLARLVKDTTLES
jgi:hypothetical protein